MPTKEQLTSPLTMTVERGDRFIKKDTPGVIYRVEEKIYHDDLSLSYRMVPEHQLQFRHETIVHENSIKKWPWVRAWKARRTRHMKEQIFTGVFYGTA